MNLGDIQDEVIKLTKEPQPSLPVFATLENVALYGNEAQKKIMRKTKNRIKSNYPSLPGGGWAANQYQTIKPTFGAVSGSVQLVFGGPTTSPILWNATSHEIQQELESLSSILTGNVSVYGNFQSGLTIVLGDVFNGQTIPLFTTTGITMKDALGNAVTFTITGVPAGNQDATMSTIANQRLYPLPSDFLEMVKVSVNNIPTTYARIGEISRNVMWQRLPGLPQSYYFERSAGNRGYNLGLFLRPSSIWPLGLEYVPNPINMEVAEDEPDIEEFLHPAIVHYVCQRIMESRREFKLASYWQSQYEKDLVDYISSDQDTNETPAFLRGPSPTD